MQPPENPHDIIRFIVAISVFGLVLALWLSGMLWWIRRHGARRQEIAKRLQMGEGGDKGNRVLNLWHEDSVASTTVAGGRRVSRLRQAHQLWQQAGWRGGLASLVVVGLLVTVAPAIVALLITKNVIFGLGVGGGAVVILRIYLARKLKKYTDQFEQQLVGALTLAARSLRAGHPLVSSFHIVSEEMVPPISDIFGEVCQQHEMGASIGDSLRHVSEQSHSSDLKLFAASVAIQSRSGGNLADLMERVAIVIRDRLRLGRRVKVLTSQTQLSKRVLLFLPVLVFVLLNLMNPDYMTPLYTTYAGRFMLGIGVVGMFVGAWLMEKLSNLRDV